MKKSLIKITAALIFTFASLAALAQPAGVKTKTDEPAKTEEQVKTKHSASVPAAVLQNVATPKAFTLDEQPKSIIPGGEFKPRDTYNEILPHDPIQPAGNQQQQTPGSTKTGNKPAGTNTPVGSPTPQNDKLVPQAVKHQ